MILVDTNLLLYAHVGAYAEHQQAKDWLGRQLGGTMPVGLPWQCLLAFVRLLSNPKIYSRAAPIPDAWRQVREWLSSSSVWIPQPTERHADILDELFPLIGRNFNLVSDAHLAALAIEHGLVICSADTDFARFPKVRWINPLTSSP